MSWILSILSRMKTPNFERHASKSGKGGGPGTTTGAGSVKSTMNAPFGKRVVGRGGKR